MRRIRDAIIAMLFYLCRLFKIDNQKIIISNYSGMGYGDNAKYIVEEIKRRNINCKIIWLVKNIKEEMPSEIIKVKNASLRSIYEQSTSKIWIDNKRKRPYIRKRPEQYYIMTWHSNICLKKVEKDAESALTPYYKRGAKNDSKMANVILSGSKFETEIIRNSFWYNGEVLQIGYPRQDILLRHNNILINQIKDKMGINKNAKVLLYAPTFRKEMNEDSLNKYSIDWSNVLNAFSTKFGSTWIGLVRLHPNIMHLAKSLNLPSNILNVSEYPDMQELLLITDCLITDYSSTIIEIAIQKKMGFIFATDYDEYQKDRSAYFTLEELPFPIAKTDEELLDAINSFEMVSYLEKLRYFLNESFGIVTDGNAAKKVVDRIETIMNEEYGLRK